MIEKGIRTFHPKGFHLYGPFFVLHSVNNCVFKIIGIPGSDTKVSAVDEHLLELN